MPMLEDEVVRDVKYTDAFKSKMVSSEITGLTRGEFSCTSFLCPAHGGI